MCVPNGVLAMSTPPYPAFSNSFDRYSLISVFLTDSETKCLTTDIYCVFSSTSSRTSSMWVRVWFLGDERPKALGMDRLSFMPGWADAWIMRSLSVSSPLNSAFASAPTRTWSTLLAVLMGYLAAQAPCPTPCLWPSFFLYRLNGTGCFLATTLFR